MIKEDFARKLIREFLYKNIIKELNEGSRQNNAINYTTLYTKISNNINDIFVNSFFNIITNLKDELQENKNKNDSFFKNFYQKNNQNGNVKFVDNNIFTQLKNQKGVFFIPLFENMNNDFIIKIRNSIINSNLNELQAVMSSFAANENFKCIISFKIKNNNNNVMLNGNPKLFVILGDKKKKEITESLTKKILNITNGIFFDLNSKSKRIGRDIENIVKDDKLNQKLDQNDDIFGESKKLLFKGDLLLKEGVGAAVLSSLKFGLKTFFKAFTGTLSRGTAIIGQWIVRHESGEVIRTINRSWVKAALEHVDEIKSLSGKIGDATNKTFRNKLLKAIDDIKNIENAASVHRKAQFDANFQKGLEKLKQHLTKSDTEISLIKSELENLNKFDKIAYRPHSPKYLSTKYVSKGGIKKHIKGFENYDEMKRVEHFTSGALSDGMGKTMNRLGYIKDIFANGEVFDGFYWFSVLIWGSIIGFFDMSLFIDKDPTSEGNNTTLKDFIDDIIKSDRMYMLSDSNDLGLTSFSIQNISLMNNISSEIQQVQQQNQQQIQPRVQQQNQQQVQPQVQQQNKNISDRAQKARDLFNKTENNRSQDQPQDQQQNKNISDRAQKARDLFKNK